MKRSTLLFAVLLCCAAAASSDSPRRPRILGIASVRILTRDLAASKDFYSALLSEDHPCVWCGQTSKNTFSINDVQYVQVAAVSPTTPSNLIDEIIFETDDVPALWSYLTLQGVNAKSIPLEIDENPALRQIWEAQKLSPKANTEKAVPDKYFSVLDPEGHRIGFIQLPSEIRKPQPDTNKMRLIHAGFVVNDRAAMDRFYKDILGFHLYWRGGMKDDQTDWVDMQVPDGTDWLEYMLNVSPTADKHERGVMNHIAIGVTDVAQSAYAIKKKGVSLKEDPQIGRDGKWQLNLYDPDQTRIELMEFAPVKEPCCSPYAGPHPKP